MKVTATTQSPARTARGSVLLAVMCLVAVLSFLVIMAASSARLHGGFLEVHLGLLRARQLAEMGVAVAAHPMVKPGDPLLRREVSGIERFEVLVSTEEGRLNLNALLTEERLPILEAILASWGFSPAEAQGTAAMLMDWVDADDVKRRPDSAERMDYEQLGMQGMPLNRPFQSLDEVGLIPRMAEVMEVMPDWSSFFTLRGSGQLDVNTATARVLSALTGATTSNAERLVEIRSGLDGIPQTEDDQLLTNVDEALFLLGITGPEATLMRPLLTLKGPTLRIESIGIAGDARCGLAVIVQGGGNALQIAEWSEFAVAPPTGQL